MTVPLDERGHDASTQALLNAFPMADKIAAMYAEIVLSAYLSAVALPDELEVVAWRPEDMEKGRAYESKYFGLVTYRGIDEFHGDKTFSFDIGRGQMRYTKRLNEFLVPRKASSEALAVLRARIDELEAAVDAEEKPHGMPWRFWAKKAQDMADKLVAAEAEVKRLTEKLRKLQEPKNG